MTFNPRIFEQGIIFALIGFAATINFSISLSQTCLGIGLLCWLTLAIQRRSLFDKPLGNEKYLYFAMLIWAAFRFFHVARSSDPLQELINARELWIMFLVPLVILGIKESKHYDWIIKALVFSGAITGIYCFYLLVQHNFVLMDYRARSFGNYHHLTYAGTIIFTLILGSSYFFTMIREKQPKWLIALFFVAVLFCAIGLFLTRSRGAYIALAMGSIFLLFITLRRRFFILLPLILIAPIVVYDNSEFLQTMVKDALEPPDGRPYTTWSVRVDMWTAGIKMFFVKPFLGFGDVDYGILYHKYKVAGAKETAAIGSHLHNDYLNYLVLFGTVGFSIFITFYIFPLIDSVKSYFAQQTIKLDYAFICLIPFSMIFLGFTQCYFTDEEVQMAFWLAIGLLYWFVQHRQAKAT